MARPGRGRRHVSLGVIDWAGVKKAVLDHPDIDPIALSHVAGDYTGMFHLLNNASTKTVGRRLR